MGQQVTYTGGKDTRNWAYRKKLHELWLHLDIGIQTLLAGMLNVAAKEQYGHWKIDCKCSEVMWWSSLSEAPPEVIKFLQTFDRNWHLSPPAVDMCITVLFAAPRLLVGRFKDLDQAFTFMDGGFKGNGVIGMKELHEPCLR